MEVYDPIYGPVRFCKCPRGQVEFSTWKTSQEGVFQVENYIAKIKGNAKIPVRFASAGIADYLKNKNRHAVIAAYLENFDPLAGAGLYLWGSVGTGKTHAAATILNGIMERYQTRALFGNFAEIAEKNREAISKESRAVGEYSFDALARVTVLCLDDL